MNHRLYIACIDFEKAFDSIALAFKLVFNQGDACSPVLFSLFMKKLALEVIQNGRHSALFVNDYFELFIFLLADDDVLLSEMVTGSQTQLNSLQRASSSLWLKVI